MEFSFERPSEREQAGGAINTNQPAGADRLRKAIERNRAKQAKRSGSSGQMSEPIVDTDWNPPKSRKKSSARRSVGKAGEQEFTTDIRKRASRSVDNLNYNESASNLPVAVRSRKKIATVKSLGTKGKSKRSSKKKSLAQSNEYIIKGVWVFCALLFVRLIFSDGGVVDYYDKEEVLNDRFKAQRSIEKDNVALIKEIELLKRDAQYQKKIVRDHLGYIAADEYLILFPKS